MLLIEHATLIDGTFSDPLEDAALLVDRDRILWTGPSSDVDRSGDIVESIDASGQFVIPGIIDAHAHVSRNGRESIRVLINEDRDDLLLEGVSSLRSIVSSGTTSVRDVGTLYYLEMSLRRAVNAGLILGPRLRTSGKFLSITAGHAYLTAREADSPDEFRKAAREQIRAGADNIKLMATGGLATPGQDVQASQLSLEDMQAAVEAAHAMGRTVAAHCHGVGGIRNSLLAGVDSIEHGTFLDEETADLMLERNGSLVLTVGEMDVDISTLSPTAQADAIRMQAGRPLLRNQLRQTVALAREKGVFTGVGTDAGGNPLAPHDFSMANEMEALVRYGYSPLEVIHMATHNNAHILRWGDILGTLEAGKLADLVILDANPLDDIANVRKISAVYQGGKRVAL